MRNTKENSLNLNIEMTMKNTSWLIGIGTLVFILTIFSCKKESSSQKEITYPDSIYYGKNILSLQDSLTIVSSQNYGFSADLQEGASLSINITDVSIINPSTGYTPKWFYAIEPIGWSAEDWTGGKQKFIATQTGKIDLQIKFGFSGETGICRLDFYENSSTITKTKYVRWQ